MCVFGAYFLIVGGLHSVDFFGGREPKVLPVLPVIEFGPGEGSFCMRGGVPNGTEGSLACSAPVDAIIKALPPVRCYLMRQRAHLGLGRAKWTSAEHPQDGRSYQIASRLSQPKG